MRIGSKLTSGFISMAVLVGAVAYVGFYQIGELSQDIDDIAEIKTPAALKLAAMQTTLLEGIEEAFAYPLLNDPQEAPRW